jgi:hypothetical protein
VVSAVWGESLVLSLVGCAAALLAFGVWFVRHARFAREQDELERWGLVNRQWEARCRGDFRGMPEDGSRFSDPDHRYAGDLDLFGPGSVFQLLSSAHTRHGQRALAALLTESVSLSEVRARQQAVRCLLPELELRQRLETLTLPPPGLPEGPRMLLRPKAGTDGPARAEVERLLEWAESPPRLPRPALVWAARVLPACALLGFLASELLGAAPLFWRGTIFLQVLVVYVTRRETGELFGVVGRWQGTFRRLAEALGLLEGLAFESPLLERLRQNVHAGGVQASRELERFDRILGWFALKSSDWAHMPINVLTGWDIHCVVALAGWQRLSGLQLRGWLEALGQLEALCSLATAAHCNPELCFPELVEGPAQLEATGLAHPLLSPEQRVDNDVRLPEPGRALLVTGSNMSGKSTLLRALGLASVMAFAGGPVCARRLRISSLGVYTSLRVNDSLADGVSRFYAELARLRAMLRSSRGPEPVLFLVDEILAGTNSVERGIGARWVLGELLRAGALGAVSTHDAKLCELPAELMARVEQVHFRENVAGHELVFDYRLRPGPVSSGNALRLMRALGLAVP